MSDPLANFNSSHQFLCQAGSWLSHSLLLSLLTSRCPPHQHQKQRVRPLWSVIDRDEVNNRLFMPATQLTPDPRHAHSWKQSVIIYLFIVRCGASFLWDKLLLVFDERWICWLFWILIFLIKQTFKWNIWTFWISSHLISSHLPLPLLLHSGSLGLLEPVAVVLQY